MKNDILEAIQQVKIEIDSGWIPIDDIICSPDLQLRSEMWDDVHSKDSMMDSIKRDGMISPPVVEVVGIFPDVEALLLSGHRRVEAARASGEKDIYCIIKKGMTQADRLALMIRIDVNQKEYTSEEKDRLWTAHWHEKHTKECKCDLSSPQKCKYSISKWAREMGIPQSTAKDHVRWPTEAQVDVTEDHPEEEIIDEKSRSQISIKETNKEGSEMASDKKPDTYYGFKEVKKRLDVEHQGLHNLVKLLEQEYKHRGIKTCTKPAYVLSRMMDMMVSASKSEEKNEKWRLKDTIRSFTGGVKSVVNKKSE